MTGCYFHQLDSKHRLIIPAKLRTELGTKLIITKALDEGILILQSTTKFSLLQKKLMSLSDFDANVRNVKRLFFGNSFELIVDSQNRTVLPEVLLQAAKIQNEITIIGMGDYCEIWSKEMHDKHSQKAWGQAAQSAIELTPWIQKKRDHHE